MSHLSHMICNSVHYAPFNKTLNFSSRYDWIGSEKGFCNSKHFTKISFWHTYV